MKIKLPESRRTWSTAQSNKNGAQPSATGQTTTTISGKRTAGAMFKSEYRPLDAELCKTSTNAVAQTRSGENPITEPTVSFFSCGFCLSWYCWLLWGSAHRAAQENTLSCRGSAQAGTEIGPEACLSVCLRGGQQYLWLLWGFTGDEAEGRKRGEKREAFFHDSQARDLLCVSKLNYDVVFKERRRMCRRDCSQAISVSLTGLTLTSIIT